MKTLYALGLAALASTMVGGQASAHDEERAPPGAWRAAPEHDRGPSRDDARPEQRRAGADRDPRWQPSARPRAQQPTTDPRWYARRPEPGIDPRQPHARRLQPTIDPRRQPRARTRAQPAIDPRALSPSLGARAPQPRFEPRDRDEPHVRWRFEAAREAEAMVTWSQRFARAMSQANGYQDVKVHSAAVARAAEAYHGAIVSGASTSRLTSAWSQLATHQRALTSSLRSEQFATAWYLRQTWDGLRIAYLQSERLIASMPAVRERAGGAGGNGARGREAHERDRYERPRAIVRRAQTGRALRRR